MKEGTSTSAVPMFSGNGEEGNLFISLANHLLPSNMYLIFHRESLNALLNLCSLYSFFLLLSFPFIEYSEVIVEWW